MTARKARKDSESATDLSVGLPPIVPARPRLLILGSLPGVESLKRQQYYAHPQNAFWHVMARISPLIDPAAPYESRVRALKNTGIALWDVLAHARRVGSLDSSIEKESETPNDIAAFLRQHPSCAQVGLNGGKAHQSFLRYIAPKLSPDERERVRITPLPSTSAAHAAMSRAEKIQHWTEKLSENNGG